MKTIKFRIEPNSVQKIIIDMMINANRLVYNNMITACKAKYAKDKELPTEIDLIRIGTRMRHNSQYVAQAYSMTINDIARRVIRAFQKTLGIHENEYGEFGIETITFDLPNYHYPRYKSYGQFKSITYPSKRDYSIVIKKKGRKEKRMLKLGKIPGLIRCYNQSTKINGDLKNCTIKRKDMGRYSLYYASVVYEQSSESIAKPLKGPIGVDIGIHNVVALSDGTLFPNSYVTSKVRRLLEKNQRKLSKTPPGSEQFEKIQTRIKHLHNKISNHRKNNIEIISSYIVSNYDPIVMENLSVKQLRSTSRSRIMTNGYNDASLGKLRRRIEDKAASAGREIILVNPRYSSQTCSVCDNIVEKNLSARVHVCPHCGYVADRDVNAARNILKSSGLFQTFRVGQPPLFLDQRTE